MKGTSLSSLADTMATIRHTLHERRHAGHEAHSTLEGQLENARDADRVLDLVRRLRHETALC